MGFIDLTAALIYHLPDEAPVPETVSDFRRRRRLRLMSDTWYQPLPPDRRLRPRG